MILNVGGEIVVCKPGEVAVFAGDIATTAKLVDGPIVDLNLMTVRGKASGVMTHIKRPGLMPSAEMLVCVSETAQISVDGEDISLQHQDAFLNASNNQIALISGSVAHITLD